MSHKALIIIFAFLTLMFACAGTQQTKVQKTSDRAELTSILTPGQKIRVQARPVGLIHGQVSSTNNDTLVIREGTVERSLPIESIEIVWVRRGSAGSGAKWGAVGFGVIGTLLGYSVYNWAKNLDESEDPDGPEEAIIAGALLGVATGALVGAAIGAAVSNWHQVYP